MSRNKLFFAVLVVLIIAFLAGIYFFYGSNPPKTASPQVKSNNPDKSANLNDLVPIDPDHPAVISAGFVYTLKAKVTDLENVVVDKQNMIQLSTDLKGKRIPSVFYLDSKTKISIKEADKTIAASSSDLQKGQTIELTTRKGLKQKTYQTTAVVILKNQPPKSASASATAP